MSTAGTAQAPSEVKHIFVLMLENHSFDHVFAMSGIPGIEAATPADSNDYYGQTYHVKAGAPASMTTDPGHEFADVAQQLFGGNAGFAINYATSRSETTGVPDKAHIGDIMACFDTATQLPVILQLAREYAVCDFWFSSLPGPTWPNRFFVHGASSACLDRSPTTLNEVDWVSHAHGYAFEHGTIYRALDARFPELSGASESGHAWRIYNDFHNRYRPQREFMHGGWIPQVASLKDIGLLDVRPLHSLDASQQWVDHFANDLHGDYPYPYTFIEPNYGRSFFDKQPPDAGPTYKEGSSQHPEDDCNGGECLIKGVYEAIRNSPLWNDSLLVIVYDEHGGFYDHVSPDKPEFRARAVPPGDGNVNGLQGLNGFDFARYGVRVPAVIVSPRIQAGTVDHTIYDHTSILATVERLFGMDPLTERDRAANDFRHLFAGQPLRDDADCPRELVSPVLSTLDVASDPPPEVDQPLPRSGNWLGFLQILLKTELEQAAGDAAAQAEILRTFSSIENTTQAKAYLQRMGERVQAQGRLTQGTV
jgi:phospholipase C